MPEGMPPSLRDGSVFQSLYCSCQRFKFSSQQLHWVAHNSFRKSDALFCPPRQVPALKRVCTRVHIHTLKSKTITFQASFAYQVSSVWQVHTKSGQRCPTRGVRVSCLFLRLSSQMDSQGGKARKEMMTQCLPFWLFLVRTKLACGS